ncbi:MAG: two-component system, sensor histidine kinase [Acidobacteriota bacterium]|jgi:CheY-like chemotaxis protein|nr:two-component system, sensor histidine kinase [Acidobacteriota bacterium]
MFSNPYSAKAPEQADGQKFSRRSMAGNPLVLVVEDHEDTRFILRWFLERSGCRVVEATDGFKAVEIAGRERPDLILMDGGLPLLDGLTATRLIRQNTLLQEVLIVALSTWATPSFHAAALAAGCNECFDKPIDFKRLKSLLTELAGASFAAG